MAIWMFGLWRFWGMGRDVEFGYGEKEMDVGTWVIGTMLSRARLAGMMHRNEMQIRFGRL